jgi:hypothetical protein
MTDSVSYKQLADGTLAVYLGRKRAGTIKQHETGYRFEIPGGRLHGLTFATVDRVKADLEGDK